MLQHYKYFKVEKYKVDGLIKFSFSKQAGAKCQSF